jgi:hypothetical protein
MHDTATPTGPAGPINATKVAAHEKKAPPPALLNEGQACALLSVSRRKFQQLRAEPWFVEKCTAVELGPRALRWHVDELIDAMKNAPRIVKKAPPTELASARRAVPA